jgi:hypothetical protein
MIHSYEQEENYWLAGHDAKIVPGSVGFFSSSLSSYGISQILSSGATEVCNGSHRSHSVDTGITHFSGYFSWL